MTKLRRSLTALATSVAAMSAVFVAAPTASAYDGSPCHTPTARTFWHNGTRWDETVRYCPLWRGNVPVYASRDVNSRIVGYLTYGGSSNWFVFERTGATVNLNGAVNNWWGSTLADNGAWGWVPEVYFSGGDNYEDDGALLMPGPVTCAGTCPTLPPWRI